MQKTLLIVRKWDDKGRAYHAPPATWLGELVSCSCGHGIGQHVFQGCQGHHGGRCGCSDAPTEILERAIRDARDECMLEAASSGRASPSAGC
jgi:hypothetical protein